MPTSRSRFPKPYLLLSTVDSRKTATKLARLLVQKGLAACVNLIPNVDSYFRWKGALDQAHELLLIIKTDSHHLKQVEQTIRTYHPYKVPEMIGWPIEWGHKPYLKWLRDSLQGQVQ